MKQGKRFALTLDIQNFAGETLQELLQARAAVHDKQKALLAKAETEGRDLTEAEETEFAALETEFEGFEAKIQAAEKRQTRASVVASREAALNQLETPPFRPSAVAGAPVQAAKKDDGGFKNLGEMIHAVRFGDAKGRLQELPIGQGQGGGYGVPEAFHNQLLPSQIRAEWSMGVGSGGGFALPEQFNPDIKMISPTSNIVRSRATVIPAGDPPDAKLTMPALDQGAKGVYGGVEVQWIGEGQEKPDTGASLREINLQPHEVAASTVITDKLLRNWTAANTFIGNLLQGAMMSAEDIAFLNGNGIGKPSGIISAPGAISVKRLVASQVSGDDIINMLAALLPDSIGNAGWIANQSLLPMISKIKDAAGNYIFIQGDATRGLPSTLFGMPIIFTGKTPTLGAKGDLMLADLNYYLIKDGSGPFIAASEHVLFKQNKTVIKVFWNVDGKPWVIEPLTLENGVTKVSPYVILDIPSA